MQQECYQPVRHIVVLKVDDGFNELHQKEGRLADVELSTCEVLPKCVCISVDGSNEERIKNKLHVQSLLNVSSTDIKKSTQF